MHEEATVLSALAKLYLHVAMVTGTSFIHILHNIMEAFDPNSVAQLAIIKRSSTRKEPTRLKELTNPLLT